MGLFISGDIVKNIATGRIGRVYECKGNTVEVEFYDECFMNPEYQTFRVTEVRKIEPPPQMKMSEVRAFVRGEISLRTLSLGSNLLSPELEPDAEPYDVTAVDILTGIRALVNAGSADAFLAWFMTLDQFGMEIGFGTFMQDKICDRITEEDFLYVVYTELESICSFIYEEEVETLTPELVEKAVNMLKDWILTDGRTVPTVLLHRVINQFDSDSIDQESEQTQALFRECLDILCEKKVPDAIQKRGYCYYCGTKVYPNDWNKARDAFEEYYEMTGDASAANTLGYIYYYGRCNGGKPEYEKAFRYFCIGHAYGYFESTYKLADMFAHGYGVCKSGDVANRMYAAVYEENLKRFLSGDMACKFADAALRMGNCFRDGIGTWENPKNAYLFYLQADLAIRERRKTMNYYGDASVEKRIREALAGTRQKFTEKISRKEMDYPFWTEWTLPDYRRCKLRVRERKNGALTLEAQLLKRFDDEQKPKMLVTVPEADYCELLDKLRIKTAEESTCRIPSDEKEIVFNHIRYDWEHLRTDFYMDEKCTGTIITERYIMEFPKK